MISTPLHVVAALSLVPAVLTACSPPAQQQPEQLQDAASAVDTVRDLAQNETKEWQNQWLGVPIAQYPTDLLDYQRLIFRTRPDVIVETGTYFGGLSFYLAGFLTDVNPQGRIVTVDISDGGWKRTMKAGLIPPRLREKITFLHGSSISPYVLSQVQARTQDKNVLVILDALHFKDHVLAELKAYSRFVQPGGYIIVNDTHLDDTSWTDHKPGAAAAVKAFLAENPEFSIDRSFPHYLISCAPEGYLVRSKADGQDEIKADDEDEATSSRQPGSDELAE